MIKKLLKLANKLDLNGYFLIADEIDLVIKNAFGLSPEREKEIEDSWEKYYADPEIQDKNLIEKEYGLGVFSDDENSFGLEPKPWHGFKWSYEGFPKDKSEHFEKFERYQTVINDDANMPETIEDPDENGIWIREQVFDKPEGTTKGQFQTVYKFVSPEREHNKRELWGIDEPVNYPNEGKEEVEVTELSDDSLLSRNQGGLKLF